MHRPLSSLKLPVFLVLAALAVGEQTRAQKALPPKVNLITEFEKMRLPPRAQGSRNTCSLFAITALAEHAIGRQSQPPYRPLSEEFLIWAGNEASGLKGDQAMFYKAVHGLNAFGICTEELMSYATDSDVRRRPSEKALADAKQRSQRWKIVWIKRWDLRTTLTDAQLHQVKKTLAEGHPVACGLRWPKALSGHEILTLPQPANVFDGHSVALVGYEDDPNKPGGGIFFFRNSYGPRWGADGYGTMSFAYVRAYANDALSLQYQAPQAEVPSERFEAESLAIVAQENCPTSRQKMNDWGTGLWSNGEQLFCGARKGGFVEFTLTIRKAGRYRVRTLATAAPDFGFLQVSLDGKHLPADFDLYAGRVSPAGSLELGVHELAAGPHRLRFRAIGKNAASTNFYFGLDAIDLLTIK